MRPAELLEIPTEDPVAQKRYEVDVSALDPSCERLTQRP